MVRSFQLFWVLVLLSSSASAGVVFKGRSEAQVYQLFGQSQKVNSEFETYLEDDKVRTDTRSATQNTSVIVRSDKKVMWTLNHRTKTYTELNEAQVKAFRAQFEKIRRDRETARMMDAMLGSVNEMIRIDRFEPKGSEAAATGGKCSKYIGYRGNKKVAEMCVVATGYFSTARAVMKKGLTASQFLQDMFPPQMMKKQVSVLLDSSATHLGLPVKVTYFMGDQIKSKTELTGLKSEWFMDPSVFEIPAGYRKAKS